MDHEHTIVSCFANKHGLLAFLQMHNSNGSLEHDHNIRE